jgi:hypothetical protein
VMMMIIINPSIININIIIYSAMMMVMMIVDDLPSIIIIYSVMIMMVVDYHPSINIIPIPSTYSTLPTNLDDPLQKNSSWQQQTQQNKLHNLVYIDR